MTDIYVDLAAPSSGDGLSPAGAFNNWDLVAPLAASGDKVWFRRGSGQNDITPAAIIQLTSGVSYIGWPLEGDKHYADRPTAAIDAGWDTDTSDVCFVNLTAHYIQASGKNDIDFCRFKIRGTIPGHKMKAQTNDSQYRWHMEHCDIGGEISSFTDLSAYLYFYKSTVIDCHFQGSVDSTGADFIGSVKFEDGSKVSNVSFDTGEINDSSDGYGWTIYATDSLVDGLSLRNSIGGNEYAYRLNITRSKVLNCFWDSPGASSSDYITFIDSYLDITFGESMPSFYYTAADTTGTIVERNRKGSLNPPTGVDLYSYDQVATGSYAILVRVGGKCYAHNLKHAGTAFQFNDYRGFAISANEGGASGIWRYASKTGEFAPSVAYRTGGANFSIRTEALSSEIYTKGPIGALVVGDSKTDEAIWASVPAGESTVEVFAAAKGVTDFSSDSFYIEVDYIDADGKLVVGSSFNVTSEVETDDSVWVNDTGLTCFKMKANVSVANAQICRVRFVSQSKQLSPAYCYIDPKPVVTAVV